MERTIILYSKYSKNCHKLTELITKYTHINEIGTITLICVDNKIIREKIRTQVIIIPCLIKTINNDITEKLEGNKVTDFILNIVQNEKDKILIKEDDNLMKQQKENEKFQKFKQDLNNDYRIKFENNMSEQLDNQKKHFENLLNKEKMNTQMKTQELIDFKNSQQTKEEKIKKEYFERVNTDVIKVKKPNANKVKSKSIMDSAKELQQQSDSFNEITTKNKKQKQLNN
jgi:hypothetical protein